MEKVYTDPATDDSMMSGVAHVIYMPVGHVEERLAIAIVGYMRDAQPFASVVTSKLLKCLPNNLGHACLNYGSIVVSDFIDHVSAGHHPNEWKIPLGGLTQGAPIEVEGADVPSLAFAMVRLCALAGETEQALTDEANHTPPRTSDEARFRDAVQEEVIRRRPKLKDGFKRSFNLAGGHANAEIDFVGSHYATCYAAINPKTRQGARLTSASAALWRLARARDAFGFASPKTIELTAWVPPEGLPIYSASDYEIVNETIAELKAQASREELGVCPANNASEAARRLMDSEGNQSHS